MAYYRIDRHIEIRDNHTLLVEAKYLNLYL